MRFQRPPFRQRGVEPVREVAPFRPDESTADDGEGSVKREAEYLRQLTEAQTPVAIHLNTGETFRGLIEYYDRRFIRLTRQGAPNLFIYKHDIKYLREE